MPAEKYATLSCVSVKNEMAGGCRDKKKDVNMEGARGRQDKGPATIQTIQRRELWSSNNNQTANGQPLHTLWNKYIYFRWHSI